jgi:hypothetical protein
MCFASAVVFAGVARERGVGRGSEVRLCWEYVRKEREKERESEREGGGGFGVGVPVW